MLSVIEMREFPFEFELKKEILFFPEKPENFSADVLEIGPGRGDVLLYLAEKNPNKKFIAIELGKKRFYKLIPRIEKKKLSNILLIQGDARIVISKFFTKENSFEKIYVLFPDPWPKDKHEFHRLLDLKFLYYANYLLKTDGILTIGSDHKDYIDWILNRITAIPQFKNLFSPQDYVHQLDEFPLSYFEEKWREMGKDIYFMKHQKK